MLATYSQGLRLRACHVFPGAHEGVLETPEKWRTFDFSLLNAFESSSVHLTKRPTKRLGVV